MRTSIFPLPFTIDFLKTYCRLNDAYVESAAFVIDESKMDGFTITFKTKAYLNIYYGYFKTIYPSCELIASSTSLRIPFKARDVLLTKAKISKAELAPYNAAFLTKYFALPLTRVRDMQHLICGNDFVFVILFNEEAEALAYHKKLGEMGLYPRYDSKILAVELHPIDEYSMLQIAARSEQMPKVEDASRGIEPKMELSEPMSSAFFDEKESQPKKLRKPRLKTTWKDGSEAPFNKNWLQEKFTLDSSCIDYAGFDKWQMKYRVKFKSYQSALGFFSTLNAHQCNPLFFGRDTIEVATLEAKTLLTAADSVQEIKTTSALSLALGCGSVIT